MAVAAAAGEQTNDRPANPYKLSHSLRDGTDSVTAEAVEGITIHG